MDGNWVKLCHRTLSGKYLSQKVVKAMCSALFMLVMECSNTGVLRKGRVAVFIQHKQGRRNCHIPVTFESETASIRGNEVCDALDTVFTNVSTKRPSKCRQCNIGDALLRCYQCGELRYCNPKCKEAEWREQHSSECPVYLKKLRRMVAAPGGPIVHPQHVKHTTDNNDIHSNNSNSTTTTKPVEIVTLECNYESLAPPGGPAFALSKLSALTTSLNA